MYITKITVISGCFLSFFRTDLKGTEADPNGLEKRYLKPCEYVSIHFRSKSSLKQLKRISEKLVFTAIRPQSTNVSSKQNSFLLNKNSIHLITTNFFQKIQLLLICLLQKRGYHSHFYVNSFKSTLVYVLLIQNCHHK